VAQVAETLWLALVSLIASHLVMAQIHVLEEGEVV
jgi:hypothetical protein